MFGVRLSGKKEDKEYLWSLAYDALGRLPNKGPSAFDERHGSL